MLLGLTHYVLWALAIDSNDLNKELTQKANILTSTVANGLFRTEKTKLLPSNFMASNQCVVLLDHILHRKV